MRFSLLKYITIIFFRRKGTTFFWYIQILSQLYAHYRSF